MSSCLCRSDLEGFYRAEYQDNIRQHLLADDLLYRNLACKPFIAQPVLSGSPVSERKKKSTGYSDRFAKREVVGEVRGTGKEGWRKR